MSIASCQHAHCEHRSANLQRRYDRLGRAGQFHRGADSAAGGGDSVQYARKPAYCRAYRDLWGWRIRSEEHTSELQSLMRISYAVFCLKKKNDINTNTI